MCISLCAFLLPVPVATSSQLSMLFHALWVDFQPLHHNEVRDITASLLTEVWPDVSIQSHLQPLTEELLQYCTANVKDNARLDIVFVGRMVRESIF